MKQNITNHGHNIRNKLNLICSFAAQLHFTTVWQMWQ